MIGQLKQEINQKLGFEIRRQADVRYLHQSIILENKLTIGFNTLRRFFGFLPERAPQLKTLEVLAQYLGYASYSDFLNFINKDQNWYHWTFVNDFENLETIDPAQIQQLIALKSQPDYVLFLSHIIKTFIRRNRIDLLKIIFSNPKLRNVEVHIPSLLQLVLCLLEYSFSPNLDYSVIFALLLALTKFCVFGLKVS